MILVTGVNGNVGSKTVRQLADAHHEVRHASYELTSAEALTGAQIAQKIAAATGRPVTFADPPPDVFRETMLAAGAPEPILDMIGQYMTFVRQGRMRVTTTVADLLGRPPRSYDQWLMDNAQARIQQPGQQPAQRDPAIPDH